MSKHKDITLTAIVPVFNEKLFLRKSINRLLNENVVDEVFIIDDCSTDGSNQIIDELTKEYNSIKKFKTSHNKGKGGAIKMIQNSINTSYSIIHDADLEYFPKDIKKLLSEIDQDQPTFVIGSRFINNIEPQNYYRTYFANKFLSFLFSFIHRRKVTDIATCYKLFPNEYFRNIILESNGFEIEVELVAKYLKKYKIIKEVGIDYESRTYKEGKKIKTLDFFRYIYAILKYRF